MPPLPIDVVFRNMPASPVVDAAIRRYATRLHRSFERIHACDVIVDQPHHHQGQGRLFHIHIRLAIPGEDVVISREPALDGAHEELHVAVRDAFRAARRQLERRARASRRHAATIRAA